MVLSVGLGRCRLGPANAGTLLSTCRALQQHTVKAIGFQKMKEGMKEARFKKRMTGRFWRLRQAHNATTDVCTVKPKTSVNS